MDFRGHLRLPDDAGTGIPVLLRLDDIFVVISSGGDELGSWRADNVVIERLYSNQFAIELDGEPMVFVAQDALGFAYDGIVAIESLQERLTKRRVFKRSKRKKSAEDTVTAAQAGPPADTEEVASTLEPTVGATEPKFTIVPEPIWTPPPTSSAPSASPVSAVPEPDPVVSRVEPEVSESSPADVRVSYPRADKPAPPAVESFVPPAPSGDPQATSTVGSPAHEKPVVVEEPVVVAEPVVVEEPVATADVPEVETEQELRGDSAEPAVDAEPEYEIEEVTAAASGAEWFRPDETSSPEADPEPEIEYDEYVLPAAGAMDTFAVSTPAEQVTETVVESTDDDPGNVEVPAAVVQDDLSPEDEVEQSALAGDITAEPIVEDPQPDDSQPEDLEPGGLTSDVATDEAVHSNGHGGRELSSDTGERRRSLFGRGRDKKAPAHDHVYGDPKTIGGLKRQVCEVCGRVTFSGEDVYQGW